MTSALPSVRRELGSLLRSVVKVLTVSDAPDYEQPWQTQGPVHSSGSGVVVQTARGPRILTNAHCVENAVFTEVRRYGRATKSEARIEGAGHECDLALLTVDDPDFFVGAIPVPIGPLANLGERVSVCGYPIGGERLSITQGIVSRIDVSQYAQSQRRLLAMQIDAAINFGNSGGPVLGNDQLIGIAFQALEDAENIGYVIPSPIIEHFLKDLENGVYDGFPSLGIESQPLESAAHRRFLGLSAEQEGGILVTQTFYGGSSWGVLEPGDVLLEVDGVEVAADGTVPLRESELTDVSDIPTRYFVGDHLPVCILRGGELIEKELILKPPQYLVAEDRYDVRPTYFVFGGLVFVPLTRDYLKTWDYPWWQNAPRDLVALYERNVPTHDHLEPVIIQKVLADKSNQGYHDLCSTLICKVQERPIRDLAELVEVVDNCTDDFVRFETSDNRQIVVDRAVAVDRERLILDRFGVPEDRSVDLSRPVHRDSPLGNAVAANDGE